MKDKLKKMEDKKYSIFISSTYEDLKETRKNLHNTIIKEGHFPLAMENFAASNKSQWDVIKPLIDKCDYYILILGFNYGSINESTNISYTHTEYNYAIEINKPVLSFVFDEELMPNKIEKKRKLMDFREEVLANKKTAKLIKTIDSIHSEVLISLNKSFKETPQTGWVRANKFDALKKEYHNLKYEYNQLLKPTDLEDCLCLEEKVSLTGHINNHENLWYGTETYKNIFISIADKIIDFYLENHLLTILTRAIEFGNDRPEYSIALDSKSKINLRSKFVQLNLIVLSDYESTITWKLTEKGKNYLYNYGESLK